MRLAVFVPVMIAAFTLLSQTTVVLNNWLVTFVDEKQSGRYIAKRQTYVLIITVILSLTGGRLLDKVLGQYIEFAILFVLINCRQLYGCVYDALFMPVLYSCN